MAQCCNIGIMFMEKDIFSTGFEACPTGNLMSWHGNPGENIMPCKILTFWWGS